MRRRDFITLTASAAAIWPLAWHAQQGVRVPRVGFMGNSTETLEANLIGPFREGLREVGYREGRNIVVDYRWAEGKYERLPQNFGRSRSTTDMALVAHWNRHGANERHRSAVLEVRCPGFFTALSSTGKLYSGRPSRRRLTAMRSRTAGENTMACLNFLTVRSG
jgi:hypothetical protein